MSKYLKEIDVIASNLYSSDRQDFMKETRCLLFLLNDLIPKRLSFSFDKLAISLWPEKDSSGKDVKIKGSYIDAISNILVIEMYYDITSYYSAGDQNARHREFLKVLKKCLDIAPEESGLKLLDNAISKLEASALVYSKEFGRWIKNSDGSVVAKLWAYFDASCLTLGVKVKTKESEYKKVFASYDPFSSGALEQIGKITFSDRDTIIYSPKKHFEEIVFRI